jgi:hypothetical protein
VGQDYFTVYLYSLKSELSATDDTKIDRAELADTPPRQFALTTPTATMSTDRDFTRIDRLRPILGGGGDRFVAMAYRGKAQIDKWG